jgi:thioredoxin-like negative regulator of GroEL
VALGMLVGMPPPLPARSTRSRTRALRGELACAVGSPTRAGRGGGRAANTRSGLRRSAQVGDSRGSGSEAANGGTGIRRAKAASGSSSLAGAAPNVAGAAPNGARSGRRRASASGGPSAKKGSVTGRATTRQRPGRPLREGAGRGDGAWRQPSLPGWGSLARRGARRLRDESPARTPEEDLPLHRHSRRLASTGLASRAGPGVAVKGPAEPRAVPARPSPGTSRGPWASEEARATALRLVESGHANDATRAVGKRTGRPSPPGSSRPLPPSSREPTSPSRDAGSRPGALHHSGDFAEPRSAAKVADAARAYAADRYPEALRILRRLVAQSPESAVVRELLGLTLYRMGRWAQAVRELEAYHRLSGSYEQFPVVADCYRAMRCYADADAVWSELRRASPSAEVMAEGRIVAAGCLADKGELAAAISLLQPSLRKAKPKRLHLRQWYALADLYERAGEVPRARELFGRIAAVDPDAYDVRQRLSALA